MSNNLSNLKQSRSFNGMLAAMVIMLMVAVGYVAVKSFAATGPATMYVQPTTGSYAPGSTISMPIRLNAGSAQINAVQATITYPAAKLQYVSISETGTAFSIDAAKSGGSGTVSIARGSQVPVTGDVLIATVTFTVLSSPGAATVTVAPSSAAIQSSDNTDVLTARTGATYTVTGTVAAVTTPVYRLANYISKERLFTTNASERDNAVRNIKGWIYEGTSFNVSEVATGTPVYRLANFITKERLFTTNAAERDNAVRNIKGWVSEGTAFYLPSTGGTVTVYRLANFITKERLFTTSPSERDNAAKNIKGWIDEGVAFTAY